MRRQADLAERRALVSTSFGPSEDDVVALTHMAKARNMRESQYNDLQFQMMSNSATKEMNRKNQYDEETVEANANHQALVRAKETNIQNRTDLKMSMKDQLDLNSKNRQQEKEASDVYKKQIAV